MSVRLWRAVPSVFHFPCPARWILLEGESGGGKSTLAALLAGLRRPAGGLLLRWGEVACAPQYHENHVLTGTFAFNLLMGRGWPPSAKDLKEAEEVARELGLGTLLDRMPGGMAQMVGETGWQLSQGERSLSGAALRMQISRSRELRALDPETCGCRWNAR
jgi:ATP-binding cassette subfamily B protein